MKKAAVFLMLISLVFGSMLIHKTNSAIPADSIKIVDYNFDQKKELKPKTELYIGEIADYDVKFNNEYYGGTKGSNYEIKTSNSKILNYRNDSTGGFIAVSKGVANLSATISNAKTSLSVTVRKPVSSLKPNSSDITISKNTTFQLSITVLPTDATYRTQALNYMTDNSNIATVNSSGLIQAKNTGTTTITVQFENKNRVGSVIQQFITTKIKVKVTEQTIEIPDNSIPLADIKMTEDYTELDNTNTLKVDYDLYPRDTTQTRVQFRSSDEEIATIDSKGNAIFKREGTVTFEAYTEYIDKIAGRVAKYSPTFIPTPEILFSAFNEAELTWRPQSNCERIYLERKSSFENKWKTISKNYNTFGLFTDNKLGLGKTYSYRLKLFGMIINGKKVTRTSSTVTLKTSKVKIITVGSTQTLKVIGNGKNIQKLAIYKNAKKYATINGKNTTKVFRNLKHGKIYDYRILALRKTDSSLYSNWSKSYRKKISDDKTDVYFQDKIINLNDWGNIKYSSKKSNMENFEVRGTKPAIKYNYVSSKNKLYIHAYLKFKGPNVNSKFTNYSESKVTLIPYFIKGKTENITYKQLVREGIKKYWSRKNIKGSSVNFKKGIKFDTEIVLHEKGSKHQNFISVKIGDQTGTKKWHSTGGIYYLLGGNNQFQYQYDSDKMSIYLSTQEQTSKNKQGDGSPEKNTKAYMTVAAHEFGHTIGLNDAYPGSYCYLKCVKVSRLEDFPETRKTIMLGNRTLKTFSSNDIEMALEAQGKENKWMYRNSEKKIHPTFQSYKNHTMGFNLDGRFYFFNYKKSEVIRSK